MADEDLKRLSLDDPGSRDVRPIPDPTVLTDQLVNKAVRSLTDTFNARLDALVDKQRSADLHAAQSVTQLRELMEARLSTLHDADQFALSQRAIVISDMSRDLDRLKELLEQKIASLTETVAVLKTTVNERFTQGDVQTEKAARDVKSAVDAAFAAAKEAVGEQNKSNALSIAKSEVATTKQIDQLSENLRISVKNTDDKIDGIKSNFDDKYTDLKDRVVAMDARGSVNDPSTALALANLSAEVKSLGAYRAAGEGERRGADSNNAWMIGMIGLLATVALALFAGLEFALHGH